MDIYEYNWLYASWIQDKEEEANKMKDFGCFVGMFSNPELARKITNAENNTTKLSDEEFKESVNYVDSMIAEEMKNDNSGKKKGKKKLVLKDNR